MTITIFVPASCTAAMTFSISCAALGIEARRRLVEKEHFRAQAPRPGRARGAAARRRDSAQDAWQVVPILTRRNASSARAASRCTARHAGELQRIGRRWRRAERRNMHRPLEHHRLTPRSARELRVNSSRIVPDVGWSRPWHSRSSTLLPAPFGPRMIVRGSARRASARRRRRCVDYRPRTQRCSSAQRKERKRRAHVHVDAQP